MSTEPQQRTDLQHEISMMKQEIEALRSDAREQLKPWYRQAPVLVSMLALLFSFGTTYYASQRAKHQDIHNAKVELRELIQRLTELPARNLEITRRYRSQPQAKLQLGSFLNTENIVLSKQAVDLIDQIPDEVSATELYAVASALALAGDYGRTVELYSRALKTANDANDWLAASRSLGQSAFVLGDVERGRASFRKSLQTFQRFPTRNSYYHAVSDAYTELLWGQAEIAAGNCSEGEQHLAQVDRALADRPQDPLTSSYAGQAATVRKQAAGRCSR